MRTPIPLLQAAALGFALLRGVAELAALQRLRLRDWVLRHGE